jgi:LysR family transcriptional regulator, transcriptional activator of the cysJI operon
VLSGEIDVALITASSNLDSLVYEPCGKAEVVPFVSTNHPLAKKELLPISELMTVPLVVRTRTGGRTTRTWRRLQALINGRGPLNVVLYCDSHRTLRHAVRSGSGLGFAYRDYLARELKEGKLKTLTIEGFTNHFDQFIVYSNKNSLSDAAEGFLAMLRRKVTKLHRKQSSLSTVA